MIAGRLIQQIDPAYPPSASEARVDGTVLLEAVIGTDGRIDDLRVINGHVLLSPAAIDAVRQWTYEPYLVDGEPVPVKTVITVNFVLER